MKKPLIIASALASLTIGWFVVAYTQQQAATGGDKAVQAETEPLVRAVKVAKEQGVDSAFLNAVMLEPETKFLEKAARINVTNYSQSPDYSHNHNAQSVKAVKEFITEHDSLLKAAEAKYGVSANAIASILWVETKLGKITGNYHVPSIYLSLALCAEQDYIDRSTAAVIAGRPVDSTQIDSVRLKVETRAKKKSAWAIEQLKVLAKLDKSGKLNGERLYGSWAGAFGFSQFLPSSYEQWGVDGNHDGRVNLYTLEDAVHSVANYLKSNGWSSTEESHRAAVYHYNNSQAYVDAVLTLAEKTKR